jgi:di/tripeptidase
MQTANRLGLSAERDSAGYVIVRKAAAAGRENARSVCLQGRLDMVCAKDPRKVHNFANDPISLVRRDGFLKADERFPGIDMVSFGPTMSDVHTAKERIDIASVGKFWDFLRALLSVID